MRRLPPTISRPRRHVVITVNTRTAITSGSHPPCRTLDRFADRKVSSTPPKATAASTIFQGCQCHSTRATTSISTVSMTSAPVTETP